MAALRAGASLPSRYKALVGLEVHAQILSRSKLFSRASTHWDDYPNTNVSLFDIAAPGTLPRLNEKCVEQAVKTALALNATINRESYFDRKHYFYADLPHGYQITQYRRPVAVNGVLKVEMGTEKTKGKGKNHIKAKGKKKGRVSNDSIAEEDGSGMQVLEVPIEKIQIEMDSGKNHHDFDLDGMYSLVNYNRAGIGLMEIVSEPVFTQGVQAQAYLKTLQHLLRHIGTCDGNMEQGSFRCDVNVSVSDTHADHINMPVEIKNLNSFRNVGKAIDYEIQRQLQYLQERADEDPSTVRIPRQTRGFDAATGTTKFQRSKETAMDYRFMPEPDLPPLVISPDYIDQVNDSIPELPAAAVERLQSQYALSPYDARVIVHCDHADSLPYYSHMLQHCQSPKLACNWMTSELFGLIKREESEGRVVAPSLISPRFPVSAQQLGQLVHLIENDTISGKIAKDVLPLLFKASDHTVTPQSIVDDRGWAQVTDNALVSEVVQGVLQVHADKVTAYREGQGRLYGFFVGQCMKELKGQAAPKVVNEILRQHLDGDL